MRRGLWWPVVAALALALAGCSQNAEEPTADQPPGGNVIAPGPPDRPTAENAPAPSGNTATTAPGSATSTDGAATEVATTTLLVKDMT